MKAMGRLAVWAACLSLFTGCSLLRFQFDAGDRAFPEEELNVRILTRGFYRAFVDEVVRTADSVAAMSEEYPVKIRSVRWKLNATSAAASSALQSLPEVSLLDLWILCRQMDDAFVSQPDSLLFGEQTPLAQRAAAAFDERIERLARQLLPESRFDSMRSYVTDYCRVNRVEGVGFVAPNQLLGWVRFLDAKEDDYVKTVGSVSEVIADLGDRMEGYSQQFSEGVQWSAELFRLRLEQDSVRDRLAAEIDSLAADFGRMVLVLEHSPELFDALADRFNEQMAVSMALLERSVNSTFDRIDLQREALQRFVADQQSQLMEQAELAADRAIDRLTERIPILVRNLLFWVVLALLLLFSLPFVAGFVLGRAKGASQRRKGRGAE